MVLKENIMQVYGKCDKCEQEALILESHIERKHKVCNGKRQRVMVAVPSMAFTYGHGKKRAPLFGTTPTGEPVRHIRYHLQGDRSEHGTWRRA